MQEIFPNVWLGSLSAVGEVAAAAAEVIADPNQSVTTSSSSSSCCRTTDHPANDPQISNSIHHWTVISILDSPKLIHLVQSLLRQLIEEKRCTHVVWKLPDTRQAPFLSTTLSSILRIIDEGIDHPSNNNKKSCCLIHCAKGVSRSVATCAAWLISRRHCLTVQQAMEMIQQKITATTTTKATIRPNMGLVASLRAIEQCQGNVCDAMDRMKSSQQQNQQQNTDSSQLLWLG
jgi:protein-tyrosine phosphatase